MADLNVLFTKDPGRRVAIGGILLDATVSERHDYNATITDHPIEAGGFVTDHKFENPRMVEITGEITDSPVAFFSVLNGLTSRMNEAHDQLKALYQSSERVTVVTGLDIYTDMVIESLSFPKNPQTGKRLQFSAVFKQTRFAASEVVGVAAANADESVRDQVGGTSDAGRQETQQLTEPQEEKATETSEQLGGSLLSDILGAQ